MRWHLPFRLPRFTRDTRGVAAVEFALLLPFMLAIYVGTSETVMVIAADRRVVLLGATLADITSQSTKLKNTDLAGLVAASSAVLAPLDTTPAKIRLSSVAIAGTGAAATATVCWSYVQNWTAYPRGKALDTTLVPANMRGQPNISYILAEVEYLHKPSISYMLTGNFNLATRELMRARATQYIENTDATLSGKPSPSPGPC